MTKGVTNYLLGWLNYRIEGTVASEEPLHPLSGRVEAAAKTRPKTKWLTPE